MATKMGKGSHFPLVLLAWFVLFSCINALGTNKPNVLLIIIDDLRPSLGCYGGPIISPNIDQLAAQSALFTNAMVQQSVCAPSRTSFLTGRRPDTTKLYDFGSYWRTHAGNYTTLPQHFKENGYFTASVGKVFHPGVTCGNNDDYPYSWSVPAFHPSTDKYADSKVCKDMDGTRHDNIMCACNVTEMPEKSLPDIQALEHSMELLRNLSMSRRSEQADQRESASDMNPPFFLAVGYRKPHVPWKYPEEFKKLYPIEDVVIADNPHRSPTQPEVAYEDYSSIRGYEDVHALNMSFPYGTFPLRYHAELRQNYYSAASYTDLMVGKLLHALDVYGFSKNTIVVFHGDHGWQLGEHAEWCKFSNYQLATRVPLLVHIPGVTDKRRPASSSKKFPIIDPFDAIKTRPDGRSSKPKVHGQSLGRKGSVNSGVTKDEFVELVDLFPTLSDLAGISVPPVCPPKPFSTPFCSEGYSFAPLLVDKDSSSGGDHAGKTYTRWKNATFSQYPRPGVLATDQTDLPSLKDITVMGYSMRTTDYHYTEWIGFNHTTFEGDWTDVKARELYLNDADPAQNLNVADQAKYKTLVQELSVQLQRGWRDSLPVAA